MYFVFDNPWGIVIGIGLIWGIMCMIWLWDRDRVGLRWLIILPGLIGLLFLADWLVETNREQLTRITYQVLDAVEQRQADTIIACLDDAFETASGVDKEMLSLVIRQYFSQPLIDSNIVLSLRNTLSEDQNGQIIFTVLSYINSQSPYAYASAVRSQWQFDFVRTNPDIDYTIQNMTLLKLNDRVPQMDVLKKTVSPNASHW